MGLEKLNVIVNNNGIGHVGIQGGSGENTFLYDPGGSFVATSGPSGSGNLFVGTDANLNTYVQFQQEDGPKVDVYSFEISNEEFSQITNAIDEQGGCAALFCASCSSSVLRTLGRF